MARLLLLSIFILSCAGSKITHRTAGDIPGDWLQKEVIEKGQPVRINYLEGDSTVERLGHLVSSTAADHVTLEYHDKDIVRMVTVDIRLDAIRAVTFVGSSSYDRKIVSRWIKISGVTIVLLIYATIYVSN